MVATLTELLLSTGKDGQQRHNSCKEPAQTGEKGGK